MNKIAYAALIIVIAIIMYIIITTSFKFEKRSTIYVFHAGSLNLPLEELEYIFEEKYPNLDIRREASGSVEAVRKVTDLGRCCHVLAVADYRLVPKYMFNKYAYFVIIFAGNSMTIAYTNSSKYFEKVNTNNWDLVLAESDVSFGFSDPNKDPCGYRALIAIALHELKHKRHVLSRLIENCTNIRFYWNGNEVKIIVPSNLELRSECRGKIVIRPKSVELISILESGALDYAFEYLSVSRQHRLGYVDLDIFEDLSSLEMESWYSKVEIIINYGSRFEKKIKGSSILYGITIPKCALGNDKDEELAIMFVKFLLSDIGSKLFKEYSQPFLNKYIVYNVSSLPKELESYLRNYEVEFLGIYHG